VRGLLPEARAFVDGLSETDARALCAIALASSTAGYQLLTKRRTSVKDAAAVLLRDYDGHALLRPHTTKPRNSGE